MCSPGRFWCALNFLWFVLLPFSESAFFTAELWLKVLVKWYEREILEVLLIKTLIIWYTSCSGWICTESFQKWEGVEALQKFYRELGNETLQGFKLKLDVYEWKQQLASVGITATFLVYSKESIGMKARMSFWEKKVAVLRVVSYSAVHLLLHPFFNFVCLFVCLFQTPRKETTSQRSTVNPGRKGQLSPRSKSES